MRTKKKADYFPACPTKTSGRTIRKKGYVFFGPLGVGPERRFLALLVIEGGIERAVGRAIEHTGLDR